MITLSIDVTKIDKTRLKPGKDGRKYMDLVLVDNKEGKDRFGNDGFVKQGQSKEERSAGTQTPIIGNFRRYDAPRPAPQADASPANNDEVPF